MGSLLNGVKVLRGCSGEAMRCDGAMVRGEVISNPPVVAPRVPRKTIALAWSTSQSIPPRKVGLKMIHFMFTSNESRPEGLTRITTLFRSNFRHVPHPIGWGHYKKFLTPPKHPNHALDLGGISFVGVDVSTVPDLIPWVHSKEFDRITQKADIFRNPIRRFHLGLSMAKRVVAISNESRRQLTELGYRCDDVIYLPLSESLHSLRDVIRQRSRSGVLIVGNGHPRKRFHLAVSVARHLRTHLTWVGTRFRERVCVDYENTIAGLAQKEGVQMRRIVDASDWDLAQAYASHSLLLVTSPWEGFCLPIPEALGFNLPVVAFYPDDFPRDRWVETIFGGSVPVVHDVTGVRVAAQYDALDVFDALNEKMGLTDYDGFVERYTCIYESVGAVDVVPLKRHDRQRVNLGCGPRPEPGYINVDISKRDGGGSARGPDVIHDLNQIPWPFETSSVDEVRAFHILEHLINPLDAATEICRILRPGGVFKLQVPHELSPESTVDWSHIHTHWNADRMKWLADPTEYVTGLRFNLDWIHEERRGFLFRSMGNITARYTKRSDVEYGGYHTRPGGSYETD